MATLIAFILVIGLLIYLSYPQSNTDLRKHLKSFKKLKKHRELLYAILIILLLIIVVLVLFKLGFRPAGFNEFFEIIPCCGGV